MNIPEDLIFPRTAVTIRFSAGEFLNQTASSIVIEGNRTGFLSLANCLIYFANSLEESIGLSSLPFITSHVKLTIQLDESVDHIHDGIVTRSGKEEFTWRISESASNEIFCLIHSLGYLNPEIHFDRDKMVEDVSIYCVVL